MKYFKYINLLFILFFVFSFFYLFTTKLVNAEQFSYQVACDDQIHGGECVNADIELSTYVFLGSQITANGVMQLLDPGSGFVEMDVIIGGILKHIIPTQQIVNPPDGAYKEGSGTWTASSLGSHVAAFSPSAFGITTPHNFTYYVVAPPVITMSMSQSIIGQGGSSTIGWTSTNAASCSSTGGGGGGTSGTFTASPNITTTYTVICSNSAGSVQNSIILTVVPNPTVNVTANPSTINNGESSNISWTSTGANFCNSGGHGTGTSGPTPSPWNVSPTTTTPYSVSCTRNAQTFPASCSGTYPISPGYCDRYYSNGEDYGPCSASSNTPVTCYGRYGGFHACQWMDSEEGQCLEFNNSQTQCTSHPGCLWTPGITIPLATTPGSATVTVNSSASVTLTDTQYTPDYWETPFDESKELYVSATNSNGKICQVYNNGTTEGVEWEYIGRHSHITNKNNSVGTHSYSVTCDTVTDNGTLMVIGSPLPDLTPGQAVPGNATVNVPRILSAQIVNQGSVPTSTAFPYFFQIASLADGGGTITDLVPSQYPTQYMGPLNPGDYDVASVTYTFNQIKTYSFRVCADKTSSAGGGVIDEGNTGGEDNNCSPSWKNIVVGTVPPVSFVNLVTSNATPYNAIAGTSVMLHAIVTNEGNEPTSYGVGGGGPPGAYNNSKNKLIPTAFAGGQGGGQSEGWFYNFFQVWAGNHVGEGQTTYNNLKNPIKNKLISTAYAGGQGGGGSSSMIDLTPTVMSGGLGAGASGTTHQSYVFPTAGEYSIRSCADKMNNNDVGRITEMYNTTSLETPNCGPWTLVTVTAQQGGGDEPDLTASALSPYFAMVGQATTFTGSISNTGAASTEHGFNNFMQVSRDPGPIRTVTDLTPPMAVSTLPAGMSAIISKTVTFNIGQIGTWYIRLCADKSNSGDVGTVDESNEFNNCGDWTTVEVANTSIPLGVHLFSDKTSLTYPDSSIKLTWATTGTPDSCTASSAPITMWSGAKSVTGSAEAIGGLTTTGTYIFNITCTKAGETDVTSSVIVNVTGNDPNPETIDVQLFADRTTIEPNDIVKLTWSTSGSPDTCTSSEDSNNPHITSWVDNPSKDTAGGIEEITSGLSQNGAYILKISCEKSGVIKDDLVTVYVTDMTGTLTSDEDSCVIPLGGNTCDLMFHWSVNNPENPGGTEVTRAGNTVGTGDSGDENFAVPHGFNTFWLYNNAKELANKTVSSECDVAVNIWNGSKCVKNNIQVTGICSITHYGCNAGTSINNSYDPSTGWTWVCQGSAGTDTGTDTGTDPIGSSGTQIDEGTIEGGNLGPNDVSCSESISCSNLLYTNYPTCNVCVNGLAFPECTDPIGGECSNPQYAPPLCNTCINGLTYPLCSIIIIPPDVDLCPKQPGIQVTFPCKKVPIYIER